MGPDYCTVESALTLACRIVKWKQWLFWAWPLFTIFNIMIISICSNPWILNLPWYFIFPRDRSIISVNVNYKYRNTIQLVDYMSGLQGVLSLIPVLHKPHMVVWYTSVIPAHRWWRHRNQDFNYILGHIVWSGQPGLHDTLSKIYIIFYQKLLVL